MKKRIFSILLALALLCSLLPTTPMVHASNAAEADDTMPFVDVPEDAYFQPAVIWALANNITNGTSDTTFSPDNACSRGEIVTFLWRAYGNEAPASAENPFSDVETGTWYTDAVLWAANHDPLITNGIGDGKFGVTVTCTRAEVVTFLWRAAGCPAPKTSENPFVDVPADTWYSDAVLWAAEQGITTGTSATTFEPTKTCTRAEVVTFLYRALAKQEETPDAELNEYGLAEEVEDGVILHVWTWKHSTVKEHIPEIAAAGYSAIQTSPIAGGGNGTSNSISSWATLYNPRTITIGNNLLGTEEEFRELVEEAHKYGVKVIVDVVINHNRGLDSAEIDWGEPGEFGDPAHPWAHATRFDWYSGNLGWNENNRLTGTLGPQVSRDLNTQNPAVQQAMKNYLISCVEAGADGFRFDAMRSVELPEEYPVPGYEDIDFSSDYLPTIIQNGASFQYGESLQGNPPSYDAWTPDYDDSGNSRLGDYQALTFDYNGEERHLKTTLSFYGQRLRESISRGYVNAEYMENMMVNKGASADYTVTWVESHDNYVNDKSYVSMDEQRVIQAWAILAARKQGTPLYYSRPLNSTITNVYGDNDNRKPGSPSFKDPQVVAVNFFHNEMDGLSEYLSNPTGTDDVIMIERGTVGAVIVNLRDTDLVLDKAPVLSMSDGTYDENVYGGTFTVAGGKISGTVKAGRVAVVYNSQVNTDLELEPSVYLLPSSKTFFAGASASGTTVYPETMSAYPSLVNVDHATYRLDDGEELPVEDGQAIVIGENMEYGSSVTVTVTGFDAEGNAIGTASATYTKQAFTGSSVRISDTWVKNRGWAKPYVYAWGADGEAFGGWPGAEPVLQTDGYWYVALDDAYALSSWNIIFNNFNGDQLGDQTLGASQHKVWNENGRWVDYTGQIDPSASAPSVSATPGSSTFDTTLDVTLGVNALVDHAAYQLGDGPETPYTDGTVLTIGADMEKGASVTLKLVGYGPDNTELVTAEYTYSKSAYKNDATIYIDLEMHPDWNISIYVYSGSANNGWNSVHTSSLPQKNGYYVYLLPDNLQGKTCTVIFSNDGSSSERVEAGWTIGPDEHKVWRPDGSATGAWEDFVQETTVYVEDGYQGWSEYAVHAWNAATSELSEGQITTQWPGIVAELQTEGAYKGFWKALLPVDFADLPEIKIIINNNGAGAQQDAGTMAWGDTRFMTKDGQWLEALPESTLDTAALEEAIALAEAVDTVKYTEQTVQALLEALENAKAVLANPDAAQEEVDAAALALLTALGNLSADGKLTVHGLTTGIEGGTILHVWCWSFNTIKEMIPQIAAAGFSAVQTSPINDIKDGDNGGLKIMSDSDGKWWWHYQPTEYEQIGNFQLGTSEEFVAMAQVAHEYGVKVIVDQVINHLTSDMDAVADSIKEADWGEPGQWGYSETEAWRHIDTYAWNESDRFTGTVGYMSTLIDWNTQNPKVQQYLLDWLKLCVESGADGFRFDAARHIELPDDTSSRYPDFQFASEFWPTVLQNGSAFQYGEILASGTLLDRYQALTYTAGTGEEKHLNTTLSGYGSTLRRQVSRGNLSVNNLRTMNQSELSVPWVESHDNYCNESSYNTLNNQQVIQAWAILAARKNGTPLFFSRPNNASSSNPWGDNLIGPAGDPFYMDPQVVAVNFFKNEMGDAEEYLSNPNGNTAAIMIERGTEGVVIVNAASSDLVLEGVAVQSMADGSYSDQVYGGTFTVADGAISGTVKAGRVAVVYESHIEDRLPQESGISLSVPDGTEFIDDTITVSVTLRGIDHATYQIDNGEVLPLANGSDLVLGEGVEFGSTIKLTVVGYNAKNEEINRAEASYVKKVFAGTVVYMSSTDARVRGWSQVYVYTWGPGSNASWPGVQMELQENGFYRYALPANLERQNGHNVIFNNGGSGGSNQFDAGLLAAGEHRVWTADREWILFDESMTDLSAMVYATPGTSTFTTETLNVTLSFLGCDSATYQLGDAEPVAYADGDVITIGADMASGETVVLKLTGYTNAGAVLAEEEYSYTKLLLENNTTIYIDPAVQPEWTNFSIYVYASDGDHGHGWPGVQQADMEEVDGLLKWLLPEDLQGLTLTVIFSNGGSSQVEQGWTIGPDQQKLWTTLEGSTVGQWIDYEPAPTP